MAITIDIRDQVSPALRALEAGLTPEQLNPTIGRAEVGLFQKWFLSKPQNKRGWPSTGFWQEAARATNFNLTGDGVLVSVNKQGVRQRFKGGDIHPTGGKKYLTIPARAEAYGKRAGEFDNLKLAFTRSGGRIHAWALVEAEAQQVSIGRKRKDGSRPVTAGSEVGGLVMFWLVRSISQKPDPTVLPPENLIGAVAIETIEDAVLRAVRQGGNG